MQMPELTMDRAKQKLELHFAAVQWLLEHWEHFPDDLYRKLPDGTFVPFDIKEYLSNLMQGDLANIMTVAQNWRIMGEADGFPVD
jgi:hypothetical protein